MRVRLAQSQRARLRIALDKNKTRPSAEMVEPQVVPVINRVTKVPRLNRLVERLEGQVVAKGRMGQPDQVGIGAVRLSLFRMLQVAAKLALMTRAARGFRVSLRSRTAWSRASRRTGCCRAWIPSS
jgi:hypothetical protein